MTKSQTHPMLNLMEAAGFDITYIKDLELRSLSWSLGGTYGNYSGDLSSRGAEPQPEFKEFDDLLLKLNPDISFLKYKKLKNESCKIESTYDHDYYGGSWEDAYHVCDLNKLYDLMVELNLLTSD